MATTTSITTTYAGERLRGYISTALLSANTIENGGISVNPNVKHKAVIKQLAIGTGDLIKAGSCDFDATSEVTLTEKYLEPLEFQVNMQLCKQPFREDWEAISMGYSAWDNLPPDFVTYFVARIIAEVATENERILWQGDATTNTGEYDGLLTLLAADADLPASAELTGTAITKANVATELEKIVDAILPSIYGAEDLYIYIPQNVHRAYVAHLAGFGLAGAGAAGYENRGSNQTFVANDLVFNGVKLFVANGLPNDTMIASRVSNLWFGTGILSDKNMLKVKDMEDVDLSENVRFAMKYTATVNYAYPEEIVTYGVVNDAN
jgi:hypothetical protein